MGKTNERNIESGTRNQFKNSEPASLADSLRVPAEKDARFNEIENRNENTRRLIYTARLANDLGERYGPSRATFSAYRIYDQRQKQVLATVKDYVGNVAERAQAGRGLVLYGSVGTGKDHLLAAALYAACAAGLSARWFSCQDFYGRIRDRMDSGPEEGILLCLQAPDVIGLSDPTPPAGELTPWRNELLYRIIDRRYHARKPTLISINAATVEEIEQKLGSQVWDRLQEEATVIACLWPSFRERRE